jgi:hypothetical protein
MDPCERLGQRIFESPTHQYKVGLAFLAWLNGRQANPMLVNHLESARDAAHLEDVARLASESGAIEDAEVAATRLAAWSAAVRDGHLDALTRM